MVLLAWLNISITSFSFILLKSSLTYTWTLTKIVVWFCFAVNTLSMTFFFQKIVFKCSERIHFSRRRSIHKFESKTGNGNRQWSIKILLKWEYFHLNCIPWCQIVSKYQNISRDFTKAVKVNCLGTPFRKKQSVENIAFLYNLDFKFCCWLRCV